MPEGQVKLDQKTKNLIERLQPGDIAVIQHEDLDEIAANSLVSKKVAAVINCSKSISGKYPNLGPSQLLKYKIPLYEVIEGNPFEALQEGDWVRVSKEALYIEDRMIATLKQLSPQEVAQALGEAEKNLKHQLNYFIDNTLHYAEREKALILEELKLPKTSLSFKGKHVLVVVRGKSYREDLAAIRSYIKEVKPLLIGVDGGGDALMEFGFTPDLLIGDMDSVSDRCLKRSKEIIVHAYPDGRAPGLRRIENLQLKAQTFPASGTSEDIAMLYAYELGAELIVVVGTHSNMIDFLEKGRKGMGSTFLVRMKIGTRLVDAKGVSQLYCNNGDFSHLFYIGLASLIPILIITALSEPFRYLLRLLYMRIRLYLGY
ncbi:putative cytokinetic ring protein SteA [Alkaliphilus crotonatoxidans]